MGRARPKERFLGWLTSVNKPLMAAGEVSKMMGSFIHDIGGVLMERSGEIAKGMRPEYNRLRRLHGANELVPLRKENGTYNFWVQADQAGAYSLHGLDRPFLHPYKGNYRQESNP